VRAEGKKRMLVANTKSVPVWQRAITVLSSTVVGFLVILVLQWGRPVLIPIALAVLLTFLMNPFVKALHHRCHCWHINTHLITHRNATELRQSPRAVRQALPLHRSRGTQLATTSQVRQERAMNP
jgi:hypothetical protein